MIKPPSFPLYVNNWLASARLSGMLPEQEGAFIRLLCHQWNSEDQSIPSDPKTLAILSRLYDRWDGMGPAVLRCFHNIKGKRGKLRNERLYVCWKEAMQYRESQHRRGVSGANKRWGGRKPKHDPSIAQAWPKHSSESDSDTDSDTDSDSLRGGAGEDVITLFEKNHPEFLLLKSCPELRSITELQYKAILQAHPKVDARAAVEKAVGDVVFEAEGIKSPPKFLKWRFSDLEKGSGQSRFTGRQRPRGTK